ncbi:uncharacterized protein MYCFIDRAFT_84904 [Pseudocercospora fijiensis CIRAD86]|uniref:Uncharacterized protein n=1 Tax=Pseudocercospora fijiensis (strain CIRAD86) TaxID=383855 RepID=M2Z065_PSEFD|nr:uncharacterized protein MYCFIDRAFT_84904 [Pseudocercospora fijiensis CIRAD86]EME83235.1 hypothetical protein MYCFIDRAFT_84904 [Pseudocercospora fijiensis CIRAD86]
MEPFRLALFLFAILSMNILADRTFKNCSSLEQLRIGNSLITAYKLITTAKVLGTSEFIEDTDSSGSSQELNEMNQRWRADVYKAIAIEPAQLTFDCSFENTTIQAMCDAAPYGMPDTANKLPVLLVKTDTGSMVLCKNYISQDARSAAVPIAHELVEIAKKEEHNRRAKSVIQNLRAIDYHAQQMTENLYKLLLSLDEFYLTDFWKRTMKRYSETIGRIKAKLT